MPQTDKNAYLRGMDFKEILRTKHGLTEAGADLVMQQAERVRFAGKQIIQAEGRPAPWAYFVEEGGVRTYVMREERCVILQFLFEGEPATPDLGAEPTARCTIETLEPTALIRFSRARLEALFAGHAELANWARRLAGEGLRFYEEFFIDYNWMDKGRQYARLLRDYPDLLQRVPLKDLAAYMSITPQTLSRIRGRIK